MKEDTKWENIGFVASSEYRRKVLDSLENPKMPSTLSKELNINKTHISRALKELLDREMIECKNPKTKKGKFYQMTIYGKVVSAEVDKL